MAYIIAYAEITSLLFYSYGSRFINEPILCGSIDIIYYIVIFLGFSACSLFAVWTNEVNKRQSFFGICMQERETEGWKKLMRGIPEPIIFVNKNEIVYFNKAVLELFEIKEEGFDTAKQLVWDSLGKLLAKLDNSLTLKHLMKNSEAGLPQEALFVYKSGTSQKRLFMIKSVDTSGVIEYIFHEVTAWKDLEKNKAKNQCFDILLATASHDIKTPLNVMLGVIDVLADSPTTPGGKEQVNVALSCGQRMLYYLKGLDFIRQINTNTLIPDVVNFNPREAATKVMRTVEFSAHAKSLSLEIIINENMPKQITSDKDMYSIILQNLLENAIKYTFSGGITLSLSFNSSKNILETVISDTGIGMTTGQLNNVGVLFKRSRSQTIMNPQGLGLGLYLAKTLAKKLNGEVTLESTPGRGTSASLFIKCEEGSVDSEAISMEEMQTRLSLPTFPDIQNKPSCECAKVLLVDDEPFNLMVFSAYLKGLNIKVDKAVNGQLALDMVTKRAEECEVCKGYAAIFMDINMPVMDGVESTTRITELIKQKKIRDTKIIAVTAAAGLDKPEVYAGYVAKGFTQLRNFICL